MTAITPAHATPVQLGAMGKIEIIEEIKRLRALVKELADAFAPFLDFYGDPYESEAEALMHKCAIAALAKARKVTP